MWFTYSILTALLLASGVMFAKSSVKKTDFEIVSAIKVLILLLFSWYSVFANKIQKQIISVSYESIIDIAILGLLISGGMLAYHAALKNGGIVKSTSAERIGSALILLSGIAVFGQNSNMFFRIVGMIFIAAGAVIMLSSGGKSQKTSFSIPAVITSVIIAGGYTFAKKEILGSVNIYIVLALALTVALLISLISVFIRGISSGIGRVPANEIIFAVLSGICFCIAVSCANKALTFGHTSAVYAVMHLGSVFSILGGCFFFKEKLTWKTACGLLAIICGIVITVFLVGVYKF